MANKAPTYADCWCEAATLLGLMTSRRLPGEAVLLGPPVSPSLHLHSAEQIVGFNALSVRLITRPEVGREGRGATTAVRLALPPAPF